MAIIITGVLGPWKNWRIKGFYGGTSMKSLRQKSQFGWCMGKRNGVFSRIFSFGLLDDFQLLFLFKFSPGYWIISILNIVDCSDFEATYYFCICEFSREKKKKGLWYMRFVEKNFFRLIIVDSCSKKLRKKKGQTSKDGFFFWRDPLYF